MTRDEFETKIADLGLTQSGFARVVGIAPQTVMGWGRERQTGPDRRAVQAVPVWVPLLLEAWGHAPAVLKRRLARLVRAAA